MCLLIGLMRLLKSPSKEAQKPLLCEDNYVPGFFCCILV